MAELDVEPADIEREPLPDGERYRRCLECAYWYGAEDDEYGPCSLKTARGAERFLTFGTFDCDEGFTEDEHVPVGEGG